MTFKCPYCGRKCDYMEIKADADLTAIIRMQPAFGQAASLVWGYVELFGIAPMRSQTKKIRTILEEMKSLFDSGAFVYKKKKYTITKTGISTALNQIVHRSFPDGLDGHNYLKKIMIGIAEQEAQQTGKQAERDLRKRENSLRYPMRTEGAQSESTPAMTPELRNQVDQLLGRKK